MALPESLDPGFQRLVDEIAAAEAAGAPRWHELSAAALRAATRDIRKGAGPVAGVATRDLTVDGAAGPLGARLYVPDGAAAGGPGLVYFHGGGFSIGGIDTHDGIAARLAALSGVRLLSVDYRLAPEHKFPSAHDDAVAASGWAFDHAAEIGVDPARIAIGGDSAGANLAASAALDMRAGRHVVRYLLLLYPNTTIAGEAGSRSVYAEGYYLTLAAAHHLFRQYIAPDQAGDPRIDLLNRDDVAGLPPTFLAVGHCDILFDECVAFAKRLDALGGGVELHTYPGLIHGFFRFADRSDAVMTAFADAAKALRAGLANESDL